MGDCNFGFGPKGACGVFTCCQTVELGNATLADGRGTHWRVAQYPCCTRRFNGRRLGIKVGQNAQGVLLGEEILAEGFATQLGEATQEWVGCRQLS